WAHPPPAIPVRAPTPVSKFRPSGVNARELTERSPLRKSCSGIPRPPGVGPSGSASRRTLATSHQRRPLSADAATSVWPSGENATARTAQARRSSSARSRRAPRSHSFTSPRTALYGPRASLPVASQRPSGEKARQLTANPLPGADCKTYMRDLPTLQYPLLPLVDVPHDDVG